MKGAYLHGGNFLYCISSISSQHYTKQQCIYCKCLSIQVLKCARFCNINKIQFFISGNKILNRQLELEVFQKPGVGTGHLRVKFKFTSPAAFD